MDEAEFVESESNMSDLISEYLQYQDVPVSSKEDLDESKEGRESNESDDSQVKPKGSSFKKKK